MKIKYEIPVSTTVWLVQESVICASFDPKHNTENMGEDDEETI